MSDINIDKDALKKHVEFLCSIRPARNYWNLGSLEACYNYICKHWEAVGAVTELQAFRVEGNTYYNVLSSYGPDKGERVIIGAHYDVEGDSPGADDNASAVAGLTELVRLFHKHKPDLAYGIDFVSYCLEEAPYFRGEEMGSYAHAREIKGKNVAIKGMISLEMIGFFSDEPGSQRYPIPELGKVYPDTANFIGVVGRQGEEGLVEHFARYMRESSDIPVYSISAPAELSAMIALSDHINYWKHGYQAAMITDTSYYRNPNYHRLTDLPDTLDYNRMAEVVKGVYHALVSF